jgi:hypothetical protein
MFDPLDEQYRYCMYCKADCWPEPENQKHDLSCPMETGLYPVDDDTIYHEGCCGQCGITFQPGDFEMNIDMETGKVVARFENNKCYEVVCVSCGTAINILGVKYEG